MIRIQKDVHDLRLRFLSLFTTKSDVIEMWNFIKEEFNKIMKEDVPTKETSSKTHQPWINTECKRLIRKKNRWFKLAKASNSGKVWKTYRKIKSECQRTCRQTHDKYVKDIVHDDKSNKKLWSYIKSKRTENIGISDLKDKNNILTTDPAKKS